MTSDFAIAVHALVYLNHRQESVSSEQIAENVCTHPVRVRRVLSRLKKAGLVATREGQNGGYAACCPAADMDLARVADAIAEVPVTMKYRTGDLDMDCAVASGMAGIMDEVYDRMNAACRQELAKVTIDQIDQMLFPRTV